MLGSKKKVKDIKEKLVKDGISKESLDKIYTPIGIKIGGYTAKEIALGIVAEIVSVKNNCDLEHMKDI